MIFLAIWTCCKVGSSGNYFSTAILISLISFPFIMFILLPLKQFRRCHNFYLELHSDMKVSKFPISLKNVSLSDFLSWFLSSNTTENNEVSKYTRVFFFIFVYRLGMAYNGWRMSEVRAKRGFGSSEYNEASQIPAFYVRRTIARVQRGKEAGCFRSVRKLAVKSVVAVFSSYFQSYLFP